MICGFDHDSLRTSSFKEQQLTEIYERFPTDFTIYKLLQIRSRQTRPPVSHFLHFFEF